MNLNTLKKGFTCNNPEKGLRSLPGAQKHDRKNRDEQSFRLSGKYIPPKDYGVSKYVGMAAFIASCLSVLGMAGAILMSFFGNGNYRGIIMPSFLIGITIVHALSILAESLKGGEVALARKGIKVFWMGLLVAFILPVLWISVSSVFFNNE